MERNRHPIMGMFLSKFDMKKGNIIEWQVNCSDFKNLEFKSLPSGIHESNDDIVHFKVLKEDLNLSKGFNHGIAYFKQNSFEENVRQSGQIDRKQVLMYSLGVIIDDNNDETNNYNYLFVSDLEKLLTSWLQEGNYLDFGKFVDYYEHATSTQAFTDDYSAISSKSMIQFLPFWIAKLGPLIFPIWKSCLLKERLLILNPSGGSFELCNALAFCISALSDLCNKKTSENDSDLFQHLLYTIGTFDIDHIEEILGSTVDNNSGYIACTSDEVVLYRTELYDKVLKLPAIGSIEEMIKTEYESPIIFQTNQGDDIKATPHELETFGLFFQRHFEETLSEFERKRLQNQTESLSWLQFFIDGFYFWFTAGTIKPSYHQNLIPENDNEPIMLDDNYVLNNNESFIIQDERNEKLATEILKYFEKRTELLYCNLNAILLSKNIGSSDPVILTRADFVSLNLDCFSKQDYNFVKLLSLKWFKKQVAISQFNYWGSIH